MRIPAFLVFFFCLAAFSAQQFDPERIRTHISYLASDELEGRGTSSKGEQLAANYIAEEFRKMGLKPHEGGYLRPFTYRYNTDPHDTSGKGEMRSSANVAGFLDNEAKYTIVIGAHYDHLGLGHDRNSLDANPTGKIHNGADDNASGTTGVIELARWLSSNGKKEPFNFEFLCFSGEELGLIGSKKWCENPDIPLDKINYMINMDMIGRLNDSTNRLIVYGVGTSPAFVPLLDSVNTGLSLKTDSSGVGPSDQTSFYLKDIPVLHFFTGQHADYHKPTDDAEKINANGEAKVLEFISRFIESTYRYPKMSFTRTRSPESAKVSFKVTLGIMPDYAFEGAGLRIDGVSENRPAAMAGLEKGDIIMKLGEYEIKDIHAYMKALSKFSKGQSTSVEVMRNQELKRFTVTF